MMYYRHFSSLTPKQEQDLETCAKAATFFVELEKERQRQKAEQEFKTLWLADWERIKALSPKPESK